MSYIFFNLIILFTLIVILICGLNFIPKSKKLNPQNYRIIPFSTFDLIDYAKFFSLYISTSIVYHFIFFNTKDELNVEDVTRICLISFLLFIISINGTILSISPTLDP